MSGFYLTVPGFEANVAKSARTARARNGHNHFNNLLTGDGLLTLQVLS